MQCRAFLIPLFTLLALISTACIDYDTGPTDAGVDADAGDLLDGTSCDCQSHEDCLQEARCLDCVCQSAPPTCGDPPPPDCEWGVPEQECGPSGGSWECGFACSCWCLAGDEGCPCWDSGHCQGACLADETDCAGRIVGSCSRLQGMVQLGCHCVLFEGGFTWICAD